MEIINIAAYRFVAIPEPETWLAPLRDRCNQLGLKGNIILAQEGINLCLAGIRGNISLFLDYLQSDSLFENRFDALETKNSDSRTQPFRKMVVRVAKEIITMRQPEISPSLGRAPAVDAITVKRWLDQGHQDNGREVVMVDTRDDFEARLGTFENSQTFEIQKFSQFPEAIRAIAEEQLLRDKTIVSFCTGGIRCEKAALYMQHIDLPHVFQLEGGILRYFEQVGGAHWKGECFVFDDRVAVDSKLQPTAKRYQRKGNSTELIDDAV